MNEVISSSLFKLDTLKKKTTLKEGSVTAHHILYLSFRASQDCNV